MMKVCLEEEEESKKQFLSVANIANEIESFASIGIINCYEEEERVVDRVSCVPVPRSN